jgi:hypothetical protein
MAAAATWSENHLQLIAQSLTFEFVVIIFKGRTNLQTQYQYRPTVATLYLL